MDLFLYIFRPTDAQKVKFQRTAEIVSIFLLVTASLISAWCVYQAISWGNIQMENVGAISLLQTESIRLTDRDNTLRTTDVGLFIAWTDAISENQTGRKMFLESHFREEFRPAFNQWLEQAQPGEIPPDTPFSLNSYSLETTGELDQLKVNMSERLDTVRQANNNSQNYILTTVFAALVLFFAGFAGKWKWPLATMIFLGIATVFLVLVIGRVLTLPYMVS